MQHNARQYDNYFTTLTDQTRYGVRSIVDNPCGPYRVVSPIQSHKSILLSIRALSQLGTLHHRFRHWIGKVKVRLTVEDGPKRGQHVVSSHSNPLLSLPSFVCLLFTTCML